MSMCYRLLIGLNVIVLMSVYFLTEEKGRKD